MTTVAKAVNSLHDVAIAVGEKKGIEEAKPFLKKIDYALALIKKQKKLINSFQYRLCQQITINTQLQNEIERLKAEKENAIKEIEERKAFNLKCDGKPEWLMKGIDVGMNTALDILRCKDGEHDEK